ncbi:hypothetical protein RFX30_16200, partial [Acinetobacter baumannii]|nr:hypothetical protein [Acinetobacter baumannii]
WFSFLSLHTFFIFFPAIFSMRVFTFLAPSGQTLTQRIQDMHSSLLQSFGLSFEIAPVGQSSAQIPQSLQDLPAYGLSGTPSNVL